MIRAVVDENGKVQRVDGLYAGDASIMPDTPSVAINPTVILMAEIVADRIKAAHAAENSRSAEFMLTLKDHRGRSS
jgi:choline dehydrogenase-like flavoprotein